MEPSNGAWPDAAPAMFPDGDDDCALSRAAVDSSIPARSTEALMVAAQSDLLALVPRSMSKMARTMFGLRTVHGLADMPAIPIKLIWHDRNDADAAHAFLRKQLIVSANHVV